MDSDTQIEASAKKCDSPANILGEVASARIDHWNARREKTKPSVYFKKREGSNPLGDNPKSAVLDLLPVKNELTSEQADALRSAELCAATGAANDAFALMLFNQTLNGFSGFLPTDGAKTAETVLAGLLALEPKDDIEGMLCSRLIVLHSQYMTFMNRATNPEATIKSVDGNVNRATKLMRLYNETLEALMRYRRKGEQKVVVQHQHVNVGNGGQAIVSGQLNHGGGGHAEK